MKDYSHLVEKRMKYKDSISKRFINAYVAGIDYKKGITIKSMGGIELTCLNYEDRYNYSISYKRIFNFLVDCIEKGSYDSKDIPYLHGNSMSSCSFK